MFYKELYTIGSYPFIVYSTEHTEGDVRDDSDDEDCRNEFCLTCLLAASTNNGALIKRAPGDIIEALYNIIMYTFQENAITVVLRSSSVYVATVS